MGKRIVNIAILVLLICGTAHADNSVQSGLFKFHLELASQGDPQSMYILGNMYAKGRGVAKDYDAAVRWFEQAALHGNSRAISSIAELAEKIKQEKSQETPRKSVKAKPRSNKKQATPGRSMSKQKQKKSTANNNQVPAKTAAPAESPATLANPGSSAVTTNAQQHQAAQSRTAQPEVNLKSSAANAVTLPSTPQVEMSPPDAKEPIEELWLGTVRNQPPSKTPKPVQPALPQSPNVSQNKSSEDQAKLIPDTVDSRQSTTAPDPAAFKTPQDEMAVIPSGEKAGKKQATKFKANPCSGPAARFMSTCN